MAWSLKKILRTRDKASNLIKYRIGNGKDILFWHEPWLENTPIILRDEFQHVSTRIRRNWMNFTTSDIKTGKCHYLLESFPDGLRILNIINGLCLNDYADIKEWEAEESGRFMAGKAWEATRSRAAEVDWPTWSSKIIPRHQFILWLTFWKRLDIRDKIKKFKNIPNVNCPICASVEESIDHLFGGCSFARSLWQNFADNMTMASFPATWEEITDFLKDKAAGDSFYANVFKCFFGATVYNIWKERNSRVFSVIKRTNEKTWDDIVTEGNMLIRKWRGISANQRNLEICQSWNIPFRTITRKGSVR